MYESENELANLKQCRILTTSVSEIIGLEIGKYIKILLPPPKKKSEARSCKYQSISIIKYN